MTTAPQSQELWQITVRVPAASCDAAEEALETELGDSVLSASRFEAEDPEYWQVQVILEQRPDVNVLGRDPFVDQRILSPGADDMDVVVRREPAALWHVDPPFQPERLGQLLARLEPQLPLLSQVLVALG